MTSRGVHAETLANGLLVVVGEDRRIPVVSVHLAVPAGARDDLSGRTGLAHLVEHLMFTGPARSYAADVQGSGGRFTATTSFQRTSFGQTVPAGELGTALAREAARLTHVPSGVSAEDVVVQRSVVTNERRQRYGSRPYGTALARLFGLAYLPGDPAGQLPLGLPDDVAGLTETDCREFLARHYRPSGMVLVIAGDTDHETALDVAARHFGLAPRTSAASTLPFAESDVTGARGEWREHVPAEGLFAMVRLPPESDSRFPAARAAVRIVEARLPERLVTQVRFRVLRLGRGSTMATFRAIAAPGVRAASVEEHLRRVIEDLAAAPPSASELARAQAWEERDRLDRTATLAGWADEMSRVAMFHGGRAPASDPVEPEKVSASEWLRDGMWAATLHCLPGAAA
ncbi:M16 family metallopeptidase [Microbispora sp. CA-135349]|uniref:M16 family metallopeptidase n=1 Tax=Microbispora sp. CA-135349 TaxID=3239953 RepID=UPI003D8B7B18